jgi:GDP-L-fucose synthase
MIEASRRTGVVKLLFLGPSCIYPRLAPRPMPESCLLTAPLEPTNEWYTTAKIAGLKLCQAYPSAARLRFRVGDADESLQPQQ